MIKLETRPDFVVFLDKDILLANFLKNTGIPVFNDPDVIETCDNKAKQYLNCRNMAYRCRKRLLHRKYIHHLQLKILVIMKKCLNNLGFQ